MNYYALCVTICLASLLLAFAASAAICAAAESLLVRSSRRWPVERLARAVFACRVAPAVVAFVLTFGLVLPSFLRFEPVRSAESVSMRLLWLSATTLLLAAIAAFRAMGAMFAGYALSRRWKRQARHIAEFSGIPVYELPHAGGLVTTTGIVGKEIFVSSIVTASLTPAELEAALAHEYAHIRSSDNLKRRLLRALRLPCASGDRAWTSGVEVSADLLALQSGVPAVELASALVKVARLGATVRINAFAAASCLIPAGQESALAERVRRLTAMVSSDQPHRPQAGSARRWWIFAAAAALAFATQPAVLQLTHELIEKLV